MDSAAQNALIGQLGTPGSASKKFRMTVIGLLAILLVCFASFIVSALKPEIAGSVMTAVAVAIPSIATMISVYSGSQASVDYKIASGLSVK